jgi:hypothetical protein
MMLHTMEYRVAIRGLFSRRGMSGLFLTATLATALLVVVFELTDPLLFRALPYKDSSHLATLYLDGSAVREAAGDPGTPTIEDWRRREDLFRDVGAFSIRHFRATVGGKLVNLRIAAVTPNLFDLLGVIGPDLRSWPSLPSRLAAGDAIPIALTAAGARLVADLVKDDQVFRTEHHVEFQPRAQLPSAFLFPDPQWAQIHAVAVFEPGFVQPQGCCPIVAVGRLQGGVTTAKVRSTLVHRLSSGHLLNVEVEPLTSRMRGAVARLALGAMAAALMVALICTGNLANLLLARSIYRRRDYVIRRALGASLAALIRLVCIELAVVAAAATVVGLSIASLVLALIGSTTPPEYAPFGAPTLTLRGVAFGIISALVTLAVAAVPAIAFADTIWERPERSLGSHTSALRIGFAATQAAFTIVLVVSFSMLAQSYVTLLRQESGYHPHTLYVRASYPMARPPAIAARHLEDTMLALRRLPNVASVAAIHGSLVRDGQAKRSINVDGVRVFEDAYRVTPDFFAAAGIHMVAGKSFGVAGRGTPGVIVNQAFADHYWVGRSAIGQILLFNDTGRPATVVGVVRNVLAHGLASPPTPTVYSALDATADLTTIHYVVRPAADAADKRAVLQAILRLNPNAIVSEPETIGRRLDETIRERTFATAVLTVYSWLGGTITVVGLAAMVGFVVARRTREIGIRVSLGASRAHIVMLATREALIAAACGAAVGLLGGRWLSMGLQSLVFGLDAGNWMTALAASSGALVIMGVASLVPAARALKLSPSVALRVE